MDPQTAAATVVVPEATPGTVLVDYIFGMHARAPLGGVVVVVGWWGGELMRWSGGKFEMVGRWGYHAILTSKKVFMKLIEY